MSLTRCVVLVIFMMAGSVVTAIAQTTTASNTGKIQASIDLSKPGSKIDRNIFGQFAEHLGKGVYVTGKLWLAITNLDPNQAIQFETTLTGSNAKSAVGEMLTAPKVDSVNTFETPNTVEPRRVSAKVEGRKLSVKLEPKSVTVIGVE